MRLTLYLKFLIGCSATLVLALGASFFFLAQRQERLIMQQVENEARVLFKQIVLTRSWIADHGGIFVEKLPWAAPSPYLKHAEIADESGRRYLRQTPAMVTKSLAEYAKGKGLYWFNITSLKLTNPRNAPDEFEKQALLQFEKSGAREILSVETVDQAKYLRYISPLYVEESCLGCHARQGYKIGDVRGAISVTVPVDKTVAEIAENKKVMLGGMALTVLALLAALSLMMRTLVLTPMRKLKGSITAFSSGAYTPGPGLRTGDEFEDLYAAFSDMAGTLTTYHHSLNDRIHAATKDLEETNSKLRQANELLNELNIRKSDFIARASHELRTPLTSIKGAMDYIAAKLSAIPPEKREGASLDDLAVFFGVVKKNSERLIRMVTTMLDIERIETGAAELCCTPVDISSLFAEITTSLQVNADERGVALSARLPEALEVWADEDRIKQVVVNLLSNAIKFSPAGGEITITAAADGDMVTAEFCDRGPGVPAEEQEKIFEKFYKSGNREGTGLGLAICKTIIEAHGGALGVRSGPGGGGSRFFFTLPRGSASTGNGTAEKRSCSAERRRLPALAENGTP